MSKNTRISTELRSVETLIKKDFSKEETISGLYKYIFKSNGKKIRARLCLTTSSKTKNKEKIKLASVIELLHTATLIHDDVVDDSPTRRGSQSVNNLWTNSHGVLIGDYIYSKAFIYLVDIGNKKILKELADTTNDIAQGELIQLDAINNVDITLNKLKKISYFKTGRLFEAAAKTGAIISNENNLVIIKSENIENELNQNGSCGGGRMGFETMIIAILIFTIIVRNYNLYYNIRKKNRIT